MRIDFEQGLYDLCAKRIKQDEDFRIGLSTDAFVVDEELFQRYRLHQLKRTLFNVYKNSRSYRRKFDEIGIKPEDISSLEDIAKLPFTFPEELKGEGSEFCCMSQRYIEKPVSYYSSGTTGIKKRILFSHRDVERILDFIGMAMHSLTDSDARVLSLMVNSFGRGASYVFCSSIERVGMKGFPADMEADAGEILRQSVENECNVWFGDVITVYRTVKQLEEITDLRKLGIRLIYITMGNVPQQIADYLEDKTGCRVMTHYGLTEAGWGFAPDNYDCEGYVYNELDVIAEIVDPETGELLENGEEGEIVLTIIGRDAMPLIRYRTGDISAFLEPMNGRRQVLKHIVRRLEGTIKCGDRQIYPAMIENVLFDYPEIIDYRLYKLSPMSESSDNETVKIKIEIETIFETIDGNPACGELSEMIKSRFSCEEFGGTEIEPVLLSRNSLKQYCYEKKRFIEDEES